MFCSLRRVPLLLLGNQKASLKVRRRNIKSIRTKTKTKTRIKSTKSINIGIKIEAKTRTRRRRKTKVDIMILEMTTPKDIMRRLKTIFSANFNLDESKMYSVLCYEMQICVCFVFCLVCCVCIENKWQYYPQLTLLKLSCPLLFS